MKNYYFIFFAALIYFGTACQSDTQQVTVDNSGIVFFDLKAFFEKEAQSSDFLKIKKTVTLDGKEETKELTDVDGNKELGIFIKANINRPVWRDKYEVIQEADREVYTALDSKLKIREVLILKHDNEVLQVKIISKSGNKVISSEKVLIYNPNKGYSIEHQQNVMIVGENKKGLRVEFLK